MKPILISYLVFVLLFFATCKKKDTTPKILTTTPMDWMSQIVDFYDDQDVALVDICLPRSHDTGTFIESSCLAGNPCNTQTQHLHMQEQLEAGLRVFDVRPVRTEEGEYFTHHTTSCGGLGCFGVLIEDLLLDLKTFLDNHAELVILQINHFCETGSDDTDFIAMIDATLGDKLYKTTNSNESIINKPIREIVSLENNTGKAIVLYEDLDAASATPTLGQFDYAAIPTEGYWSNVFVLEELKADQFQRFEDFNDMGSTLFELSWTMTQNTDMAIDCFLNAANATSILDLATIANDSLQINITELITNGNIHKDKIPNMLSVDFADTFVTDECIKITVLSLE